MSATRLQTTNSNDFEQLLQSEERPILVDFSAPWCAPCRNLEPLLCQLEQRLIDKVRLIKINIDMSPEIARRFAVRSIPTLLLLKGEEELHRIQDTAAQLDRLVTEVEPHL